jgi:hypothetical protein
VLQTNALASVKHVCYICVRAALRLIIFGADSFCENKP